MSGLAAFLAACGTSSRPGTVSGALPLCYGPGPNSNLWPSATITIYRANRLIDTKTFPSSVQHHRYVLALEPGPYELRMDQRGYAIAILVKSGAKSVADWPDPVCL